MVLSNPHPPTLSLATATTTPQEILIRWAWYCILLSILLTFKFTGEANAATLPLLVYPRVLRLHKIANALTRRTDEVVASLVTAQPKICKYLLTRQEGCVLFVVAVGDRCWLDVVARDPLLRLRFTCLNSSSVLQSVLPRESGQPNPKP